MFNDYHSKLVDDINLSMVDMAGKFKGCKVADEYGNVRYSLDREQRKDNIGIYYTYVINGWYRDYRDYTKYTKEFCMSQISLALVSHSIAYNYGNKPEYIFSLA